MILEGLVERLENWLRGKDILHYVPMPSVVFVEDLEIAEELKRRYSLNELIVVHCPEALKNHESSYFNLDKQKKISGVFISGTKLSSLMARIYEKNGEVNGVQDDLTVENTKIPSRR